MVELSDLSGSTINWDQLGRLHGDTGNRVQKGQGSETGIEGELVSENHQWRFEEITAP